MGIPHANTVHMSHQGLSGTSVGPHTQSLSRFILHGAAGAVGGKTGTGRGFLSFFASQPHEQKTQLDQGGQYGHVGMSTVVRDARSQQLLGIVNFEGPREYSVGFLLSAKVVGRSEKNSVKNS